MEGGTSFVLQRLRAFSFGKIPFSWWIPQKERLVLAVASTAFWTSSIAQAVEHDPGRASIFAFYGLGLFYVICGMANIGGNIRKLLREDELPDNEQTKALLQLFGVLASMVACNTLVLLIYTSKGVLLTPLDKACILITLAMLVLLAGVYGLRGAFKAPYARGWLAIACKALPQLLLAVFFILKPETAHAFTLSSLFSLVLLASLRFWPSWLAYNRDRSSTFMQGLLLGEAGNMLSILLMVLAWCHTVGLTIKIYTS